VSAPTLRPFTDEDRPVVERLWQLYRHDLSEYRDSHPGADGLFKAGSLTEFFGDPDRCGYLVTRDVLPVGFALVQGLESGPPRMIAEFFVVRSVRRQGVGHAVASELLRRYPGDWEIGFQEENRGAPEFWRGVVTDLVGETWREELRPVAGKPHIPPDHVLVLRV
jgi:predicted acetyltransferase